MGHGVLSTASLNDSPHDTTWVYLDGLAGQGGFGSAATIFKLDGEVRILCPPSIV